MRSKQHLVSNDRDPLVCWRRYRRPCRRKDWRRGRQLPEVPRSPMQRSRMDWRNVVPSLEARLTTECLTLCCCCAAGSNEEQVITSPDSRLICDVYDVVTSSDRSELEATHSGTRCRTLLVQLLVSGSWLVLCVARKQNGECQPGGIACQGPQVALPLSVQPYSVPLSCSWSCLRHQPTSRDATPVTPVSCVRPVVFE